MTRVTLEAAHIIPHSLSEAKTELDREQKKKVWQALRIFAGEDIKLELEGQKIDALENILILQHDNHVAFGKLDLWFTQDEVLSITFQYNLTISSRTIDIRSILSRTEREYTEHQ